MTNKNNKQVIGLFGFGVVGEGLYHVLKKSRTTNAFIKKICVLDKQKERPLPGTCFCFDPAEIINDPEVNLVVELINDDKAAYDIVRNALKAGKSVVSGNKKMIAENLEELILLQKMSGSALLYDASACGSIPVIRNLEEYYDNDLLVSITGILNGSSNFILSRIFNDNMNYLEALRLAKELGFAEADPSFDVDGYDSLYKLVILAAHGFGSIVRPENIYHSGISTLNAFDIRYAKEKGRKLKLVAQAIKTADKRFSMFVMPKLVEPEEYIYNVENEYNGVIIEGEFYEKQFMFGKGAGGLPTGSSVLSDITARMHGYQYEYKKRVYFNTPSYTNDIELQVYVRSEHDGDLAIIDFTEVHERFQSQQHHYITGKVSLNNLLEMKEEIFSRRIFTAFFD
jgi:homoserine dehydrogenase